MPELMTTTALPAEIVPQAEPAPLTRGQKIAADITALLRARNALLWIVTREEARVEALLFEAALTANYQPHTWDIAAGVCGISGNPEPGEQIRDAVTMLSGIMNKATSNRPSRDVWIMRDLPALIPPGLGGAIEMRSLRNLARKLPTTPRANAQAIIVLTPSAEIPAELQGHATVIEFPLPDRAEIESILDSTLASLPEATRATAAPNGTRSAAIDAAVGLSGEEASACYAKSLVQTGRIDPATVASEKKRVIARERVLEWFDPLPGGLDSVGGLDQLKAWLISRAAAYSPQARAYGLPPPKGAMLCGVPGCGKSLTAKAIATAWGVPLLRLDLGALKSKFVGESEGNLRKAFAVIEAIGRCVVWLDEIEKSLGSNTSAAADGGVSADALGAILSWMQERRGESFVIATANDATILPAELLRKGRFDEIWSIDLPTNAERVAILKTALKQHGRAGVAIDCETVASACETFTGSEIANLIPDSLFRAFADSAREITTDDLLTVRQSVVPLARTMGDKLDKIRAWVAEGRARPATTPETIATASTGRKLDL